MQNFDKLTYQQTLAKALFWIHQDIICSLASNLTEQFRRIISKISSVTLRRELILMFIVSILPVWIYSVLPARLFTVCVVIAFLAACVYVVWRTEQFWLSSLVSPCLFFLRDLFDPPARPKFKAGQEDQIKQVVYFIL